MDNITISDLSVKQTLEDSDKFVIRDENNVDQAIAGSALSAKFQAKGDYVTETALETTLNDYETSEHAGNTYQPKGNYVTTKSGVFERIDTLNEGGQVEYQRADSSKDNIITDIYNDSFRIFSTEGVGLNIDFNTKKISSFGKDMGTLKSILKDFGTITINGNNGNIDLDISDLNLNDVKGISILECWPQSSWDFSFNVVRFTNGTVSFHFNGNGRNQQYTMLMNIFYI